MGNINNRYKKMYFPAKNFQEIKDSFDNLEILLSLAGYKNEWNKVGTKQSYLTVYSKPPENYALVFHKDKNHHVIEIALHCPKREGGFPYCRLKINDKNSIEIVQIIKEFESIILREIS